jgi:Sulfotransferase family
MSGLSAEQALNEAREQTGLNDFGPDSFQDGLAIYLESVTTEAQLNEIGTMAIHANVVGNLANRLRVVDWANRHREVTARPVTEPLIVIGMFRAGTTLLSNLLDQDRANRSLLRWESADSVPPPTPASLRVGPRVDASRAGGDMLELLNPKMAAIHHEEADGPTECVAVMSQDFRSLAWEAISNVPTYSRWLLQSDHRPTYEYHRLVLQVLQSGGATGRWMLKSPHHALALPELTAVYPDARLVLMHRDPVELCASVCSLIATLTGTFSSADHSAYIASHWVTMLEQSVDRINAFRDAHPEFPILDVQYTDLMQRPVETVEAIQGQPLSPIARQAIAAYLAANPKGSRGAHRYDVAEFGLRPDELRQRFAGYIERYDIPVKL